ncbi:DUF4199 family protein [Mucilaginibacter auburnensis]|uniref:Uncharacterized protein DUF4199 n=1 Tax=Mucilaginibacter auburnensis TaxID=1457233 RepID=A0A2H9VTN1_9SPHI|nr:DUF4199 family protein [Mucilaginibacter auburnensis]PJJ84183.1 uncharacterized protein DUF4199 [Mucilaginibacter auburnensis]
MANFSLSKTTYINGLIMGIGFCLYTTLMWLTGLDSTYLYIGQYFDMLIVLLPVVMIVRAIKQEQVGGHITFLKRVVVALVVAAISFVIYEPFLYVYHHHINPEWYNAVLTLKETELKAANTPAPEIARTLQQMRTSGVAQADLFRLSAIIPSVIILPLLITLLSYAFVRNSKVTLHQ